MSNNLIVHRENIIMKIKKFFLNLFKKDHLKKEEKPKEESKENFKNEIIIKQNEEELKIIKLQKAYKAGDIREEDMTEEEKEKLIELYKSQNKALREKIEYKKNNLKKRLDDLKAS